jgi:hypothetical protein
METTTNAELPELSEERKPNRKERRAELQASPNRNAKNTNGRKTQVVPIKVKKQYKFGTIVEDTGFKRKIDHQPVVIAKIDNRIALNKALRDKVVIAEKPADTQDLSSEKIEHEP